VCLHDKIVQVLITSFRQMAKRRFPGSEGCNETSDRSPSVENLNNGMNPDQPGNDWEENRRRENPREAPYPPPSAFAPHIQIPSRLHLDQDQSNSLNYPSRTRNEQLQLPLPIASMDVPSSSETNRTQSQGQRIPNENETGNVESSGLSLRAKRCIENLILRPLMDSGYELPNYLDKVVVRLEIICLRDLEADLFQIPNVSSVNKTYIVIADFFFQRMRAGIQ
jgi:hypothetical protein